MIDMMSYMVHMISYVMHMMSYAMPMSSYVMHMISYAMHTSYSLMHTMIFVGSYENINDSFDVIRASYGSTLDSTCFIRDP